MVTIINNRLYTYRLGAGSGGVATVLAPGENEVSEDAALNFFTNPQAVNELKAGWFTVKSHGYGFSEEELAEEQREEESESLPVKPQKPLSAKAKAKLAKEEAEALAATMAEEKTETFSEEKNEENSEKKDHQEQLNLNSNND